VLVHVRILESRLVNTAGRNMDVASDMDDEVENEVGSG
jgi:hypothetical protein